MYSPLLSEPHLHVRKNWLLFQGAILGRTKTYQMELHLLHSIESHIEIDIGPRLIAIGPLVPRLGLVINTTRHAW